MSFTTRTARATGVLVSVLLALTLTGGPAESSALAPTRAAASAAIGGFEHVSPTWVRQGGYAFFVADDGTHGFELWRTDGTPTGTALVADLNPGAGGSFLINGVVMGATADRVFFVAGGILYAVSGDGAPVQISANGSTLPGHFEVLGTTMIAIAQHAIYRIQGGSNSYQLVSNLDVRVNGQLAALDGYLYFGGSPVGASDYELWRTDGTSAGTDLVKVVNDDSDARLGHFTSTGSRIFFHAKNPADVFNDDLWTSDGTTAGTKRIASSSKYEFAYDYAAAGGAYFFSAETDSRGYELWLSRGAAPKLVKDIARGRTGSKPNQLTRVGNRVVFIPDYLRNNKFQDGNLWVSNGTAKGTREFHNQNRGSITNGWVDPSSMVVAAGRLSFATMGDVGGGNSWTGNRYRLWRSGLTSSSTWTVADRKNTFQPKLYLAAGSRIVVLAKPVGGDLIKPQFYSVALPVKKIKMKRKPKVKGLVKGKVKLGKTVRYKPGKWNRGKPHYRWILNGKQVSTKRKVRLFSGKGKKLWLEVRVRQVGGPDKVWRSKKYRVRR